MTNLKKLLIVIASGIMTLSAVACTTDSASTNETIVQSDTSITTETTTSTSQTDSESESNSAENNETQLTGSAFDLSVVPDYNGDPYVEVNNNTPYFTKELLEQAKNAVTNNSSMFTNDDEEYLPLDDLGRCQVATGLLSTKTMPPEGEEREGIGMIKPAGWHTIKYPDIIPDLYLYNRCHLIGWQLGSENANELNLTTGTRYLNMEGMLPFENETAEYIRSTNNHVLYRITPVFVDNELVCRGILIEAQSIEDNDLQFCVYCYNVQPYVRIDYLTGDSEQIDTAIDNDSANVVGNGNEIPKENLNDITSADNNATNHYVLNTSTKKIHRTDCSSIEDMNEENKEEKDTTLDELINEGYEPCKRCNPR